MECSCKSKRVVEIKVEADLGADPLWCNKCGINLDLDHFMISNELKEKLINWMNQYGEWIDWSTDTLIPTAKEMEDRHNTEGENLTKLLAKELAPEVKVEFSPATIVMVYRQNT
ncbi:hypothetical protein [Metabacillus litoralis]|uniref:hypothetical protein n=1 Tax=Metabacillus litoralis TaxID=152268 RepID=UPI001CFD1448|nr:hypothetical protein [Metabacillus litoralis]